MYTACMFCQKDLGRNQVVEHFQVGRRLVFDSERGRLWVVCRKCERWNLTPLEERWEAVEECERLFRDTRVRAQTPNMGMAKHPEGLVLIRVGEPLRDEFAAWRYGDQFGRRRNRMILTTTGIVVVVGAAVSGALAAGIVSAAALGQSGNFVNLFINGRTLTKIRTEEGETIRMKRPDLAKVRLLPMGDEQGWGVRIKKGKKVDEFTGSEARRVAGQLLPHINSGGGKRQTVQQAVARIEAAGHPEQLLKEVATWRRSGHKADESGLITKLEAPSRLALEMALHEEQERRALEGELWLLEQRWREAEEIAGIADSLLLPEGAEELFDKKQP